MADPTRPSAGALEPSLTVVRVPGALRGRILRALRLTTVMAVLVGGTVSLSATGHLGLPFQRVITLDGRLASVGDVFQDPEVIRILRKHNLVVHLTTAGSREVATGRLDGLDFVFPSGQSAAQLVFDRRRNAYSRDFQPFTSPLVLATYRKYAEALTRYHGVAAPQPGAAGSQPLYYWLDMDGFLDLTQEGRSWNDIGFGSGRHSDSGSGSDSGDGNVVFARTSDICQSNSADSYLGLVAYVRNHHRPPADEASARQVAERIAPLLLSQGSPGSDLSHGYFSAGSGGDPVVAIYEHQYLAYQSAHLAAYGTVDTERVLLYPRSEVLSEPQFIALDKKADRLGELLMGDAELRTRLTQLGYRLSEASGGDNLTAHLKDLGIPAPATQSVSGQGKALLPDYTLLDDMISAVEHTLGKTCRPGSPG